MRQPFVVIQGMPGAYTEQAALQMHGPDVAIGYLPTFDDAFAAVRCGEATSAVVAIANVNIGFIGAPHQELLEHGGTYWIEDETHVTVKHQLLGPPGAVLSDVRRVHSMGPAIQQSTRTLHFLLPHAEIIEEEDTAISAEIVSRLGDRSHAAIASARAGELNGLEVIKADIQDKAKNVTRFLSITRRERGIRAVNGRENKTTILLDVPERHGALFKSLAPFWATRTNITTLHSSYVEESDFTERFFMEFEAGIGSRRTKAILSVLRKLGGQATILGSYQRDEAYHKTKGAAV